MKNFTIFLLDDDGTFCELLATLIEHKIFASQFPDYKVILYTYYDMFNIVGAVLQIQNIKPDLVLLDYMLGLSPGACLDSLAVLEKIIPYCADIQLVSGLYSGDIRLDLLKDTLEGVNIGFLPKPFGVDDLVDVVKGSIQRKENG